MKAINVCALSLMLSAGPALSATCKNSHPAGGETTSECVRGEELKADAPSLGDGSVLPSMDQREIDALRKLMEQPPAVPAPERQ